MRSALWSALLGISLLGCVSTIGDGEAIDTDGDGTPDEPSNPDDDVDPQAPAKVTVTSDTPTINTELGTTSMITLDVATENFTGPVNLTASVIDPATSTAIPGWTVTLAQPTMNFTGTGTQSAVATLVIPTEYSGTMNAQVKVDAVSSVGTQSATTTVTALNQVSIDLKQNEMNGNCILPTANTGITLKVGTKIRFVNKFASGDSIVIHGENGISHQESNPGTAKDTAYEITRNAPTVGEWWCHAPSTRHGRVGNQAQDNKITWVQ